MRFELKTLVYPLIAIAAVAGSPAYAGPSKGYHRVYFSDATQSVLVGDRSLSCEGDYSSWGVITPYYYEEIEDCKPICGWDPCV